MEFELLGQGSVLRHHLSDFLDGGRTGKLYANGCRVPVSDVYPVALRAHIEQSRIKVISAENSEDLSRLILDLLFFTTNKRKEVICYIQRGNTRIACTRNCLHRGDHYCFNAEGFIQGRQGQHDADRGTVRISYDKSSTFA